MFKEYKKLISTVNTYEKLGFKMLPVGYKAKRPLISKWTTDYFSTGKEMTDYLTNHHLEEQGMNVGVLCGKVSNLVVIDCDIDKKTGYNGVESVKEKEKELGELPPTVTVQSQSDGTQYWFRYPKGVDKITSTTNKLKSVDIRADGSQVVAYPSRGEKGHYYWIYSPEERELAELPEKWVEFLRDKPRQTFQEKVYIKAISDNKENMTLPLNIGEGVRNDSMFKYACSLYGRGKSPEEVEDLIRSINHQKCNPPLSDYELSVILESAYKTNSHTYFEFQEKKKEMTQGIQVTISKPTQPLVVETEKKESLPTPVEEETTEDVEDEELYDWLIPSKNGAITINEGAFAKWFIDKEQIYYINERFYNSFGTCEERKYKNEIQTIIEPFKSSELDTMVNKLLNAIKNAAYFKAPKPNPNLIHLKNTTLKISVDGIEEVEKSFTFNRLNIEYDPKAVNYKWLKYLNDLFEKEDITTLQEYFGYCLIPSTRGQKSLFITGNGGEGKSGISYILQRLFDNSSYSADFQDIEENEFLTANFENKLVFIDDDMEIKNLNRTGKFKKLVTNMGKISVNKKGVQQYEIEPYIRFICIGNGMISSSNDKTDGFYSRILWLKVKPIKRRGTSQDNVFLYYEIAENLSGILNWALEGLQRLVKNGFRFTLSDESKKLVEELQEDTTNIIEFMKDENYVCYSDDPKKSATTNELYTTYIEWCESADNKGVRPYSRRMFSIYLKANADKFGIEETRTIMRGTSQQRGFKGVYIKE